MKLFGRLNIGGTTTNDEDCYNVTKLRSLYASLIEAIQPEHERLLLSSPSNKKNRHRRRQQRQLNQSSSLSYDDDDVDDDDDDNHEIDGGVNDEQNDYSIRHFRASRKPSNNENQQQHDDDGGDTIHFNDDLRVGNSGCNNSSSPPTSDAAVRQAIATHNAWLRLSATITNSTNPTLDHLHDNYSSSSSLAAEEVVLPDDAGDGCGNGSGIDGLIQNEEDVAALLRARRVESRVVELIRSIGEVVVYGEQKTNGSSSSNNGHFHQEEDVDDRGRRRRNTKKNGKNSTNERDDYDAVFEYFCDKNILSLLVDIATAKPPYNTELHQPTPASSTTTKNASPTTEIPQIPSPPGIPFSGVVYTALVKSQVLQTISILVSNVRDPKSLYYLLSNNYINELVASLVPLHRLFTVRALEELMPVYITFLKTCALHLASNVDLFQFFCDGGRSGSSSSSSGGGGSGGLPSFPLFYAAVDVASSPIPSNLRSSNTNDDTNGQISSPTSQSSLSSISKGGGGAVTSTDTCFVHTTALNIILNLCQLPHADMRLVISESFTEQRILVSNLCQGLMERYDTIARMLMGRRVADDVVNDSGGDGSSSSDGGGGGGRRIESLEGEMGRLEDGLCFINDLLWCSVDSLNVRLCECLVRCVIMSPIMENMVVHEDHDNDDGANDDDQNVIGEDEAYAQTSVFFLTQIFMTIDYVPLLKMIAVALLHPYSPLAMLEEDKEGGTAMDGAKKEYRVTPALNGIAQNSYRIVDDDLSYDSDSDNDDKTNDDDDDDDGSRTRKEKKRTRCEDDTANDLIPVCPNPYRNAILSLLRGDLGNGRFISAAMLFESVLEHLSSSPPSLKNNSSSSNSSGGAIDSEALKILEIFPNYSDTSIPSNIIGSGGSSGAAKGSSSILMVSPFEEAIGHYFNTFQNASSSTIGSLASDCALSLSIRYIDHHFLRAITDDYGDDTPTIANIDDHYYIISERFRSSPLIRGICNARRRFALDCRRLMGDGDILGEGDELKSASGVRAMIPNLLEIQIRALYEPVARLSGTNNGSDVVVGGVRDDDDDCTSEGYIFNMRKENATTHRMDIIVLGLLSRRDIEPNEICDARFAIRMVLRLGVLSNVMKEAHDNIAGGGNDEEYSMMSSTSSRWLDLEDEQANTTTAITGPFELRTICPATEDIIAMGGLTEPPKVGSDRNLRDRTYFFFSPSLNMTDVREKKIDMTNLHDVGITPTITNNKNNGSSNSISPSNSAEDSIIQTEKDRRRKIADVILTRATSRTEMVTLVEGEELYVLKPKFKSIGEERGTILCSTKLRNILGTAIDGEWLHVAMREQVEDVGVLIKKGNMALRFDSMNTCLSMKDNLEKGQLASHRAVLQQVESFLQRCLSDGGLASPLENDDDNDYDIDDDDSTV